MTGRGTLKRRISRTFLLQAVAISLAAIVSVLLAASVIKQVLVTEALRMEAEYFWKRYAADHRFPLPDTRNLTGYLVSRDNEDSLPPVLRQLEAGFHDVPSGADFTTVHVTEVGEQRLLLVFDGERVDELAAYFGLVPFVVVLVVLYLSVWLAFRASHRAVSPIARLARAVDRLDPETASGKRIDMETLPANADEEVRVLAEALSGLTARLDAFIERERTFTRDASHELRTPLTVIRVATDIMLEREGIDAAVREDVMRIRRSSDEMERLTEAFLLLARESEQALPNDLVCVNDVVEQEIDQLRVIKRDKPVDIELVASCRLLVEGPEPVVVSVIGNLLRNALAFTDSGTVRVTVQTAEVVIEDSGIGMEAGQIAEAFTPYFRGQPQRGGGHGVGLTIVKRFADRFNWTLDIESEPGQGTSVSVRFPHSHCQPLAR